MFKLEKPIQRPQRIFQNLAKIISNYASITSHIPSRLFDRFMEQTRVCDYIDGYSITGKSTPVNIRKRTVSQVGASTSRAPERFRTQSWQVEKSRMLGIAGSVNLSTVSLHAQTREHIFLWNLEFFTQSEVKIKIFSDSNGSGS